MSIHVSRRGKNISDVGDILSRRELFSVCKRSVGHYGRVERAG